MIAQPLSLKYKVAMISLALVQAALFAWEGHGDSPTWDEPAHLAAGIFYWQSGHFRLYNVNPPLIRLWTTAPLMIKGSVPQLDTSRLIWNDARARPEFALGGHFAVRMGDAYFGFLRIARWSVIPLCLLGGFVCFFWARDLFGNMAAVVAMTLWIFDPMILAFGHLIVPDVGATSLGLAASYIFWRYLRQPSAFAALAAGALLGFAELAKFTWVALFPLWPMLAIAYFLLSGRRARRWGIGAAHLCLIFCTALWVINIGYGFEDSFKPLGEFDFASKLLGGDHNPNDVANVQHNRFDHSWIGHLPVPVPGNFLRGVDVQRVDFESKSWSYLNGQWRFGGWWYYYLIGLGIKVPLGTWVMGATVIMITLTSRKYSAFFRDELFLLAPAIAIIVLVSFEDGFNHHVRYAMPALPFAYIWLGKAASWAIASKGRIAFVFGALIWSIASSVSVLPHSLSYYNEIAGGPMGGPRYLGNSNSDWGQDVLYLGQWLDAHPEAGILHFANDMPFIAPAYIRKRLAAGGVPIDPRSESDTDGKREVLGPRPGWYAVSVNQLHARGGKFAYFLALRPIGRAGYSIYIYHVTDKDVQFLGRSVLDLEPPLDRKQR